MFLIFLVFRSVLFCFVCPRSMFCTQCCMCLSVLSLKTKQIPLKQVLTHVPRTGMQFLLHTWHPSALSRCTPVSTINKGDRHDGCKIIFCRSLCFSPHFSFPCCGVVLLCFVCPRSMFCSQCCMFLSALSILDCSMPPSHSDKDHAECSTS